MSKKTLLEEGTVRRFMKLAEMQPLAGDFVNEMYGPAYQDDDEAAEEAVPADATPAEADYDEAEFEAGEEEGELEDLGVDLVDDEEEEAVEMEMEDAGEIVVSDEEARIFLKIADKIRAGLEAADEEVEELPAPDMGDMGEEEEETEEITVDEEPPAEEEMDELEETQETDDLVQEIARRVAKRLLTNEEN